MNKQIEQVANNISALFKKLLEEEDPMKGLESKDFKKSIAKEIKSVMVKSPKTKKDPNSPKQPCSAYIRFCNNHRAEMKNKNPDVDGKEIIKKLATAWKACPDKEKKKLESEYKKEREEYKEKKDKYERSKSSSDEESEEVEEKEEPKKKRGKGKGKGKKETKKDSEEPGQEEEKEEETKEEPQEEEEPEEEEEPQEEEKLPFVLPSRLTKPAFTKSLIDAVRSYKENNDDGDCKDVLEKWLESYEKIISEKKKKMPEVDIDEILEKVNNQESGKGKGK